MMKRAVSILVALVMIFVLLPASAIPLSAESAIWDGSIATSFARGTGTEADPYIIETAPQLAFLANSVNNGTTYSGKYIKLANDIVLNNTTNWESWGTTVPAHSWTPIGNSQTNSFRGRFGGEGHNVSGLYINNNDIDGYQGLFGYIVIGVIENLGITESCIKGCGFIGNIAGRIETGTIINNCYNSGEIIGIGSFIGGIAGYVDGCTISNCCNTGKINGSTYTGGVAGYIVNSGAVNNSYNTGTISGDESVGGVVGYDYGTLRNCYNTGEITATGSYVGGVEGTSGGVVSNSYNTGAVNGSSYIGGVVGNLNSSGSVSGCYYLSGAAAGGINGTDAAGQAVVLNDAQMKSQSNFVNWDFDTVWEFGGMGVDYEYPNLISLRTAKVLTINYQYSDESTAAESVIQNLLPGDTYSVTSPTIDGYSPDIAVVSGTMGDEGITITVTYTQVIEGVWDGSIATGFASGTGTEADPYIIETAPQLAFLANSVNSGTYYEGKFINLADDIFLNDTANWQNWDVNAPDNIWIPIGSGSSFFGTFNGNGHTVSGIYINGTGNVQGLFGFFNTGLIMNVGVIAGYIKGGADVGAIVGNVSNGIIENCFNSATVTGTLQIGGIAGVIYSSGLINRCYNLGIISAEGNIGGIVGKMTIGGSGTVLNCYNTGSISGYAQIGGIIGTGTCSVSDCYNTGEITGTGDYNEGGIAGSIGNNSGSNCYYLTGTAEGGINCSNIAGQAEMLTDAQMKLQTNFVGWDFDAVWEFGGTEQGYLYPTLIIPNGIITVNINLPTGVQPLRM